MHAHVTGRKQASRRTVNCDASSEYRSTIKCLSMNQRKRPQRGVGDRHTVHLRRRQCDCSSTNSPTLMEFGRPQPVTDESPSRLVRSCIIIRVVNVHGFTRIHWRCWINYSFDRLGMEISNNTMQSGLVLSETVCEMETAATLNIYLCCTYVRSNF